MSPIDATPVIRPVFIAGTGAVTPFGRGASCLVSSVIEGRSALRKLERLAGTSCSARVAAEFPHDVMEDAGDTDQLAFHVSRWAGLEALDAAPVISRKAMGLVLSTTKADLSGIIDAGRREAGGVQLGLGSPQRLGERLVRDLEIAGPMAAVSCACASGLSAIAVASRWIAHGRLDHVLVIGVDVLNDFVLSGFASLLALDSEPCRPFDESRAGLSLGEAAGAILLTSDQKASTGVRVAGWGGSNEAHHITRPHPDGIGLRLAASRALRMADVAPSKVACVHLHGTGTLYNDAMEANALATLFEGTTPPAFGSKAQTGHTLGAAGIIESLIAVSALTRGECPSNVGLQNPGVDSRLDLTMGRRKLSEHQAVLKVAAGFGGIGAAVVYAT